MRHLAHVLFLTLALVAVPSFAAVTPSWRNVLNETGSTTADKLQNAMDNASASTGEGVVYLPAGVYSINAQRTIPGASSTVPGLTIRGDGIGKTVLDFTGTTQGLFRSGTPAVRNLTIEGITFKGTATSQLLYLDGGTQITIRNCEFIGAGHNAAIYLSGVTDATIDHCKIWESGSSSVTNEHLGIALLNSDRAQIHHNTILSGSYTPSGTKLSAGIGIEGSSHVTVNDNQIYGVVCETEDPIHWGYGIYLYITATNAVSHNVVANNLIVSSGGPGIYMKAVTDTTITGNVISQPLQEITAEGALALGGIAAGSDCARLRITDNEVTNIPTRSSDGAAMYGIHMDGSDSIISGNTISGVPQAYGISVSAAEAGENNRLIIADNQIANAPAGIFVLGSTSAPLSVAVTGNTFNRGSAATSSSQGIYIGGANDVTVTGNRVTGASYYGINLAEVSNFTLTGNVIRDSVSTTDGILLNSVSGGIVSGNRSTGQRYGINIDSGCSNVRVTANSFRGNGTNGIQNSSGTTTTSENDV